MIKEEMLDLVCAAINDCDNKKMKQTSETLRALLSDLEVICHPKQSFAEFAYELYKQQWIETNSTQKMRIKAIKDYRKYVQSRVEQDLEDEIDVFEVWLRYNSYTADMYCFNNFYCELYPDEEYMSILLEDEDLISLYYKDIGKLSEEEIKKYIANRSILHEHLSELQGDLEDLSDEDLLDCRGVMLKRINACLNAILEKDEDNEI